MIELASGLISIPFLLCAPGDLGASDDNPRESDYHLCIPWAVEANPRTWDEVVGYYTEPPFVLPDEFRLMPPVPSEVMGRPSVDSTAAANPLKDEWNAVSLEPHKLQQKTDGDWGSLQSQMVIQEGQPDAVWVDPLLKRQWQTDEAWKLAVLGPLSVFGQVGAATAEIQQQDMKVMGKTGLACALPTGIPQAAVTLRSGPSWTSTDALRPNQMRERTDWVMEVEGRVPLIAGIGLEYLGTALPALTPMDHDRLTQDLHLAIPMGSSGKFTLGAKYQWEGATDPRAATDSTQLYLGLELKR
jgi:hypothetical protein